MERIYYYSDLVTVLRVGDKVKAVVNTTGITTDNPCDELVGGRTREIVRVGPTSFSIAGCAHEYGTRDSQRKLVLITADEDDRNQNATPISTNNPDTTMSQILNPLAEAMLDKDTKNLIKTGYLNSDLSITDKAKNAMWTMALQERKAELAKLANAELEKEEKCK